MRPTSLQPPLSIFTFTAPALSTLHAVDACRARALPASRLKPLASRLRTPVRHNFYYLSGRLAEPLGPLNALASISYSLFGHFIGAPMGRSVSAPNETCGPAVQGRNGKGSGQLRTINVLNPMQSAPSRE